MPTPRSCWTDGRRSDRDRRGRLRLPVRAGRGSGPRVSGTEAFGLAVSVLLDGLSALRDLPRGAPVTAQGWLQIALYVAVLTALTPVLGAYMARVYSNEPVLLTRVVGPVERLSYRVMRVDPAAQQDWRAYARTALVFSVVSFVALYLILRSQGIHPFNPEGFASAPWDVTFNTTSSFVSNTNWQFYAGETTLSYFSQMAGLAVQNFLSAAVGMAVLAAVIRGFASRGGASSGTSGTTSFARCSTSCCRSRSSARSCSSRRAWFRRLAGYVSYATLHGAEQTLALGPVASQVAIKQLGTNGGGFFNVNSAMPFENPTRALELRRGALHPADPGGADRDVRADGRQPPPGLGALRGDARDARGGHRRRLRAPRRTARRRSTRQMSRGRATCRTRSSASASRTARSGPRSRRPRRTGPSTRRTRRTPGRARWCRS